MPRYTSQKEFSYSQGVEFVNIIADSGAAITLEIWNGVAWEIGSSSPLTKDNSVNVAGLKIRLTPDVGGYFISNAGWL